MTGKCTKCGWEGRLYYAKPTFQWCENCLTKTVVDCWDKIQKRVLVREWRKANQKMSAAIVALAARNKALETRVAWLEARIQAGAPTVSFPEQIRNLLQANREA